MGKKRIQYTKEYKVEAVRLIVKEGKIDPFRLDVSGSGSG